MDLLNTSSHSPRDSRTAPESESTESYGTGELASSIYDARLYQPLDQSRAQIRLLWVHPGAGDSELVGRLEVVDLPSLRYHSNEQDYFDATNDISTALSTAICNKKRFSWAQIIHWERLCQDLLSLYYEEHLKRREKDLDENEIINDVAMLLRDEAIRQLQDKKKQFMHLLIRYQKDSSAPFDADAVRAIVRRLDETFHTIGILECMVKPIAMYEAISYCCGDQTITETICLNGNLVQAPISAVRALRALRLSKHVRPVWIDAICIDSNNPTERSHQVMLMADIYASATWTVAWLNGEHDEAIRAYHASLRQLSKIQGVAFSGFNFLKFMLDESKMATDERACHKAALEALSGFLKDPWFTWLWVYQEALLSREPLCHVKNVVLHLRDLRMAALQHLESSPHAPRVARKIQVGGVGDVSPELQLILNTQDGGYSAHETTSLKQLLLETSTLKCENPRDRIHALLGLAVWAKQRLSFPETLRPDYTAPLDVCMRGATLAVIQEDKSLDCLMHIVAMAGNLEPAWAVPWYQIGSGSEATRRHLFRFLNGSNMDYASIDDCSDGHKLELGVLRVQGYPNSLFLKGHCFDKVVAFATITIRREEFFNTPIAIRLKQFLSAVDTLCTI